MSASGWLVMNRARLIESKLGLYIASNVLISSQSEMTMTCRENGKGVKLFERWVTRIVCLTSKSHQANIEH